MTAEQRRDLRAIAAAPLPVLRTCSDEGFDRCMAALSILPRRKSGSDEGAVLLEVYRRALGGLPSAQLVWVVDTALVRLKWFPTIAELLEIAGEWRRDDEHARAQARAEAALRHDRQARYDGAMTALSRGEMDQGAIDALPLPWAQAAARLGWLVESAGRFALPRPVAGRINGEAA
ncbi:hypothetical protein FHW96_000275 [Novosphingobium sp. SG751A]|uniref:hypothetical protein n=1 Tax=Novosphingobium sp. SG751A TaxID=2587000 RepID=UPI0015581551|nr:hypothetical protein [Novosphingobium sp. SG751A]NOW44148.1 hypothetical protein [Novosphingobium sp. SG751A]